jgi:hypothetical protein
MYVEQYRQSLQSARLSFQSSKLGPPPFTLMGLFLPPPLGPRGETHSLAGEGGKWTQFRRRYRHSGTIIPLQCTSLLSSLYFDYKPYIYFSFTWKFSRINSFCSCHHYFNFIVDALFVTFPATLSLLLQCSMSQ